MNLSDAEAAPDFTTLSFYKIFGYPDLGGLIVCKDSGHILQWRKYFGGGTVDMVVCLGDAWHASKDYTTDEHYSLHDQLEDGTLPFHSIIALGKALEVHARLFGSMQKVSSHTAYLAKRLYDGLSGLKHNNGTELCRLFIEPASIPGDPRTRGATIAFDVHRADGSLVPYSEVERAADARRIHVRSGGLCNPGGIATYLRLEPWEMKRAYSAGHRCGHATEIVLGKPTGVVRASLGAMSIKSDVDALVGFLAHAFTDGRVGSATGIKAVNGGGAPVTDRITATPRIEVKTALESKRTKASGDASRGTGPPKFLPAITEIEVEPGLPVGGRRGHRVRIWRKFFPVRKAARAGLY